MLANVVSDTAGPLGPYAILASLVVLSSLLSQGLDGAPAVVLVTPVALQAAETLGLSVYPVMMGVSLAASAAFMTPFSHKANLLVMGAGGYRAMDYVRVGTLLTVLIVLLIVVGTPLFFPFWNRAPGRPDRRTTIGRLRTCGNGRSSGSWRPDSPRRSPDAAMARRTREHRPTPVTNAASATARSSR